MASPDGLRAKVLMLLKAGSLLRAEEEYAPLQGRNFWEHHLPWALPRVLAYPRNQEGRPRRLARRPRTRCCLLKGRKQRFHPRQVRQSYCSKSCRQAVRRSTGPYKRYGDNCTPEIENALSLVPNRERRGGMKARVVGGASAPRRFRLGD